MLKINHPKRKREKTAMMTLVWQMRIGISIEEFRRMVSQKKRLRIREN